MSYITKYNCKSNQLIKSFHWCKIQILDCYQDKHDKNYHYKHIIFKFKQHSHSIRLYLDVLGEVILLQI